MDTKIENLIIEAKAIKDELRRRFDPEVLVKLYDAVEKLHREFIATRASLKFKKEK